MASTKYVGLVVAVYLLTLQLRLWDRDALPHCPVPHCVRASCSNQAFGYFTLEYIPRQDRNFLFCFRVDSRYFYSRFTEQAFFYFFLCSPAASNQKPSLQMKGEDLSPVYVESVYMGALSIDSRTKLK